MSNIIIIADDLTGANDTGVQFCKSGYETFVVLDHSNLDHCKELNYSVLSINANSRILNEIEAYDRVYSIVKQIEKMDFDIMYKKIDSVFRGNPGAELEGIMDAINAEIAIVAPSFPGTHRIIKDGYLYVGELNKKNKKEYVPDIFQCEMNRKVISVGLDIVRRGEDTLKQYIGKLVKNDKQIFIIDAITDNDLNIIANASKNIKEKTVLCGSGGFAQQIPYVWGLEYGDKDKALSKSELTIVAVGSRHTCTAAQVKKLIEAFDVAVVKINTQKIIEGKINEVISEIEEETKKFAIDEDRKLIIIAVDSIFNDKEYIIDNLKADSENADSQSIVNVIGKAIKQIYKKFNLNALLATGGDTSLQICKAFEAKGITLIEEIIPGIPSGKLVGGIADGLCLVTKSGGFGSDKALVEVLEYLESEKKNNFIEKEENYDKRLYVKNA